MEGFSFVTPITGLNRPNTGKEDDDDIFSHIFYEKNSSYSPFQNFKLLLQENNGNLTIFNVIYLFFFILY
jgi:hypothetical protein